MLARARRFVSVEVNEAVEEDEFGRQRMLAQLLHHAMHLAQIGLAARGLLDLGDVGDKAAGGFGRVPGVEGDGRRAGLRAVEVNGDGEFHAAF